MPDVNADERLNERQHRRVARQANQAAVVARDESESIAKGRAHTVTLRRQQMSLYAAGERALAERVQEGSAEKTTMSEPDDPVVVERDDVLFQMRRPHTHIEA